MGDIKRNPEKVLNSLSDHSSNPDYKFERLYRTLFNEEMFYHAYQNIYAKPGNMTEGADGKTIDGMSIRRIEKLMDALRNETYQPHPSKRTYIPKKNGNKRPLGIPSLDDKLVQEVIRMILQAIYEGSFSNLSHGFRPHRSCQTALMQCQRSFSGTRWFIEGDIKGFFDNINHDVLIRTLEERITDDRFIRLIRKFLNAGYVEDWKFFNSYSGTPQGGIVSPILANIYLDKFDKYMEEYIRNYDKGQRRKETAEHLKLRSRKQCLTKKLKKEEDTTERKILINEIRNIEQERRFIAESDDMDTNFKRMKYVRYADDFLIGVVGSKEDSQQIKQEIKSFLQEKLQLELSDEKTLITQSNKPARFLGFDVYVRKSNETKRNKLGALCKSYDKRVVLNIPKVALQRKLMEYDALRIMVQKGKEVWRSKKRPYLLNNDDLEILSRYNAEIRGLYNYYSIANNSSFMHSFSYIMEYSMYGTFANKYRISLRQAITKFKRNGVFTVYYTDRKGNRKSSIFYNKGFKRKTDNVRLNVDNVPGIMYTSGRTSLIERLQAQKCELCRSTENLEMHHIRKMKDLKGKEPWVIKMIARKRKTMADCHKCHVKIHNAR
ncbi:group II intron reverse transcriptase/maturase [Sphingobacterium nematocida]|uniref:Group II intron reverse transcriptase/maturase n=1 Tax=Sphingobacterium nematocida TaxID=1513896 RepID=A0A1T5FHE4_9SPHI|nr:reverse transcriptase/maturase family protein [Sphingobacterium nematocida]SKB95518.1 group II intron reverse transcriptase/maturase [Sphingobacterium nematocida]